MQWLAHLGEKNVLRINSKSFNNDLKKRVTINGENADFYFEIGDKTFAISDVKAIWYRKGSNWLNDEFFKIEIENHETLSAHLTRRMESERQKLGDYINYIMSTTTPVLGTAFKNDLNKLIVLDQAKSVGLKVPDFAVSNSKNWISKFLDNSTTGIITKSMSEGIYLFDSDRKMKGYFTYTEEVKKADLQNIEENIVPSFVQNKVEKAFEVRSFFMEGTFYSMAIFSQDDAKTKIDFRKYNEEKPNRMIPYILPNEITAQLSELFKLIGLNTGSVDLLVDEKDNFYFLEINPVGQFGMVSLPCNYFLEKKVAINLMKKCKTN